MSDIGKTAAESLAPYWCHERYSSHVRRYRIGQLPRMRLVCGRDQNWGFDVYQIGLYWSRNFDVQEGEMAYRRWLILRMRLRLHLDRSR